MSNNRSNIGQVDISPSPLLWLLVGAGVGVFAGPQIFPPAKKVQVFKGVLYGDQIQPLITAFLLYNVTAEIQPASLPGETKLGRVIISVPAEQQAAALKALDETIGG